MPRDYGVIPHCRRGGGTMGKVFKVIPFFVDGITIVPHTCSKLEHFGKPLSVKEFSDNMPISMSQDIDTGDYMFKRYDGTFAVGPEEES